MTDLIPVGVDATTGQSRQLVSADTLIDSSGNAVLDNSNQILSSTTVDMAAPGNTTMYIVPTGKTVYITEILVVVATSTNVTNPAIITVGATASDDVVNTTTLVNLINTGKYYSLDISALAQVASAGDSIKFYITTAVTGTGPAQTTTVHLLGIQV